MINVYGETGSAKRVSLYVYGKFLYEGKKAHTNTENTNQFKTYPEHTCEQFPGVNFMLVQSSCVLRQQQKKPNKFVIKHPDNDRVMLACSTEAPYRFLLYDKQGITRTISDVYVHTRENE